MATMIATPQTIATCHSPAWAPVRTAVWTAPQPKKTRRKVPSTSARQRALKDGVGCPMQEDLCGERPFGARKGYSNFRENDGKPARGARRARNYGFRLRICSRGLRRGRQECLPHRSLVGQTFLSAL